MLRFASLWATSPFAIGTPRMAGGLVLAFSLCAVACGTDDEIVGCADKELKTCHCDSSTEGTQKCSAGFYTPCKCDGLIKDGSSLPADSGAATGDTGAADGDGAGDAGGTGSADTAAGSTDIVVDSGASQPDTKTPPADTAGTGPDTGAGPDTGSGATDAGSPPKKTPCTSDKQCSSLGKVCDPLTNTCTDCLFDLHCKTTEHCVGQLCTPFVACGNSLDCKAVKGKPICDVQIKECVVCVAGSDCKPTADCVAHMCVPYQSCKNSKDCKGDTVCDTSKGRCVQCLADNDCGKSQLCASGSCMTYTACASDKVCVDEGKLCDKAIGKCAQCLDHKDCPAHYHCAAPKKGWLKRCLLDVCAPTQGYCDVKDNARVVCNTVGDGYGAPQPCGAKKTCTIKGIAPICKARVCTPGKSCEGTKAVDCEANGLKVNSAVDCAASGKTCKAGACVKKK